MNITVLTNVENDAPKSYDAVVGQVAAALRRQGHRASILGVRDDLQKLVAGLKRRRQDLVFNLLESFGDDTGGDVAGAGVLDWGRTRQTPAASSSLSSSLLRLLNPAP